MCVNIQLSCQFCWQFFDLVFIDRKLSQTVFALNYIRTQIVDHVTSTLRAILFIMKKNIYITQLKCFTFNFFKSRHLYLNECKDSYEIKEFGHQNS